MHTCMIHMLAVLEIRNKCQMDKSPSIIILGWANSALFRHTVFLDVQMTW